jgi:aryl-alcohol dehydrogenase-like predicted oxidoreductase
VIQNAGGNYGDSWGEFMKYRTLGRTGFDVSEIGHGLWGMSGWSGSEDEGSRESLQLSASLGCNFFDTAWAYGDGKSDALLGELLARNYGKRQSAAAGFSSHIYAASKIPPMNRKWPASPQDDYAEVFPAKHVLKYVELIRDKLGVDSIDLLQFHVWDDRWAREPEFKRTVGKLKTEGLIRAFGLSLNRWEPENGIAALRTGLVDVVQVIYNIFDQSPEEKLFPVCKELNIGVIARVPLDEGSLGGKMTPADTFPPNDFRARYFGPENLHATLERVEKLKAILPAGMSLPEMAIRFILSNPVVSTTIIGMRKPENVRQNVALSEAGPLDAGLLSELKNHRWDRKPHPWSA